MHNIFRFEKCYAGKSLIMENRGNKGKNSKGLEKYFLISVIISFILLICLYHCNIHFSYESNDSVCKFTKKSVIYKIFFHLFYEMGQRIDVTSRTDFIHTHIVLLCGYLGHTLERETYTNCMQVGMSSKETVIIATATT